MVDRSESSNPFAHLGQTMGNTTASLLQLINTSQNYIAGLSKYASDFMIPYLISTGYFRNVESERFLNAPPIESFLSYLKLLDFNIDVFQKGLFGGVKSINHFTQNELGGMIAALYSMLPGSSGEELLAYTERQARLTDLVVNVYPEAIQAIEPEYGFHFERGEHKCVAETDRFYLYQIAPSHKNITVNDSAKPLLILPPYVLGANILGFLPGENRSYAHCFANRGIPTYIRILKDIQTTEALQLMTGENDALDTQIFCETIKKRHDKQVTLNGYCQGGFSALCNLLTGKLDGLVDAFITCVAPMDGTRSRGLSGFLGRLPERFNDLVYGTKTLPSGNKVADGTLMGWVYKLTSIGQESPVASFYRDIMMFARQKTKKIEISKTAAGLNYWLNNERNDLPMAITEMSFASYNQPITSDGTLPIKLFGNRLNLNRIKEMSIPWLICYGIHDDLVEKETALAPLDWIEAEVTPFPKGHVAIATSWSDPESACALHTRFGEEKSRGPVLFQMDLDRKLSRPVKRKKTPKTAKKK